MCTLLAVPSWRSWSHDPNEGRPSAAPVNCLQESERERERRECQAELKMRKGVLGSGSCGRETRGRRWVVVVVREWGGTGEMREGTVRKRSEEGLRKEGVIRSCSS